MPQEPISPGGPIFREAAPPTASKRRLGLSQGTAMEAWPGMGGKQGRNPKKRGS
jgi:hypothetical protein